MGALHLNKLESPSTKDVLCQIWLKLSFEQTWNLFTLEQTWNLFTQGCFVPSLVKIGPVVLEKKLKIGKVYGLTDGQKTDDRWSEKLTWAFSSGELKEPVNLSHLVIINQTKQSWNVEWTTLALQTRIPSDRWIKIKQFAPIYQGGSICIFKLHSNQIFYDDWKARGYF